MSNNAIKYTTDQKEAIETIDSNLQIIACAGSGKTGVVSQRIVHILKTVKDIKPENIVAFTFTDKAAGELKSRIYKLAKEQIGELNGLAEMYIGTIHSFCLNILQDYLPEYQKYSVLDEVKTKLFVDKNFNEIGMKHLDMEKYKDTDVYINLVNILRESEVDHKSLPEKYMLAVSSYDKCFVDAYFLDYTMIMQKLLEQLEKDKNLRDKLAKRIKYLTVDEYQDVNPIQEKLIKSIYRMGANVCVVGDDDQTIYQWRGSDINNILNFSREYSNVKEKYLVDNFRSSLGIVELSQTLIKHNVNRKDKKMVYKSEQKYEPGDIVYMEYDEPDKEADYIANRIIELKKAGVNFSDIAILIRIKRLAKELKLIDVFNKYNIKFIIEGVNELMSVPEVQAAKSIFDYLNKTIDKSVLRANWENLAKYINIGNLDNAIKYLDKWAPEKHKFYGDYILQRIFQEYLDIIEIKEPETSSSDSIDKDLEIIFYNLGKFSQVINDYETINFRFNPAHKLNGFCSFLRYSAEDYYPEGYLQNQYIRPDAVRIMTIHQAKGLEFPVVFVPGLSKNIFPNLGMRGKNVWQHIDPKLIPNSERYMAKNVEDERRLYYVAITRAEKFLFLTRSIYNQRMNREPSILLQESKRSSYIINYSSSFIYSKGREILPKHRKNEEIILNFSVLNDYYYCPYRFKLTYFYGFVQPIAIRQGYGKSLHNMVMDIHKRVTDGITIQTDDLPAIVLSHMHVPFANDVMASDMTASAEASIKQYFWQNQADFSKIVFVEKNIELDLGDGIRVNGRIDLIKKKDLDKERTIIVDFKTHEVEKSNDISAEQLKIYALGYRDLSGENADYIEFYNLDNNVPDRRVLDIKDLDKTKQNIVAAAKEIRDNRLYKQCAKEKCSGCYLADLCLLKKQRQEYGLKA